MNNPKAFAEAYWSINSLRVYTASGSPASSASKLSTGAIVGIAIGAAVLLVALGLLYWRYRVTARRRRSAEVAELEEAPEPGSSEGLIAKSWVALAGPSPAESVEALPSLSKDPTKKPRAPQLNAEGMESTIDKTGKVQVVKHFKNVTIGGKKRMGKTVLAPGKTSRHYLDGETPVASPVDEGGSRRGSVAVKGSTFVGTNSWVESAKSGGHAGSLGPRVNVGGGGWVS